MYRPNTVKSVHTTKVKVGGGGSNTSLYNLNQGIQTNGRDGAAVRALASHQCGPSLIPGPGIICGLSLLLVLVPAMRVFLRVLQFSSLHKNQHF